MFIKIRKTYFNISKCYKVLLDEDRRIIKLYYEDGDKIIEIGEEADFKEIKYQMNRFTSLSIEDNGN